MDTMTDYTTINHTADIGIAVAAADLPSLFKKAALAMFDQMIESADLPRKPRKKNFKVEIKGGSQEELLVGFLSELLSLSDSREVVFRDVEFMELTVNKLRAIATGVPRRHFTYKTEIKAVTYHDLKIGYWNKQYHVQIIFDV